MPFCAHMKKNLHTHTQEYISTCIRYWRTDTSTCTYISSKQHMHIHIFKTAHAHTYIFKTAHAHIYLQKKHMHIHTSSKQHMHIHGGENQCMLHQGGFFLIITKFPSHAGNPQSLLRFNVKITHAKGHTGRVSMPQKVREWCHHTHSAVLCILPQGTPRMLQNVQKSMC